MTDQQRRVLHIAGIFGTAAVVVYLLRCVGVADEQYFQAFLLGGLTVALAAIGLWLRDQIIDERAHSNRVGRYLTTGADLPPPTIADAADRRVTVPPPPC